MVYILYPHTQKKGSVTQKVRLPNTNEEVRSGITKYERYNKNNLPTYGGVNDPRMGSFNPLIRCKTCDCTYAGSGSKMDDCPGHFGHIELIRPVYHCGFIDEVAKILRCVCYHCSRLLIDEKNHKDRRALQINDSETRLRCIHDCCRIKKRCLTASVSDANILLDAVGVDDSVPVPGYPTPAYPHTSDHTNGHTNGHTTDGTDKPTTTSTTTAPTISTGCGAYLPKYTRKGMEIEIEYPDDIDTIPGNGDKKQKLSATRAYDILKRISNEDVRKLGLNPDFSRPEWFLVSVLPVPPPHVRPSVMAGDGASEDDLTHILCNIIKVNMKLEDSITRGDPPHIIQSYEELLQHRITAFFDNERQDTPTETQRTGRPLKSIRQRLRGNIIIYLYTYV